MIFNESEFDELKVGKMLYLLWENTEELGLTDSLTEDNYKERIEEMSDLFVNFTKKWIWENFVNFLIKFYEAPKKVKFFWGDEVYI